MFTRNLVTAALLAAAAAASFAAAPTPADSTREERMDEALQNYRNQNPSADQPGPMARAEESIKRGARKTGDAIKHGARKTGEFVGKGVRKTGEAMQRGGEKLEGKSGADTAQ